MSLSTWSFPTALLTRASKGVLDELVAMQFLCFLKPSWGEPLSNISSYLIVWSVMARWCCNMPKFLFTGKLPIKKKKIKNPLSEPACPPISLSAWFMVVTVSLSGNVSQKCLWVIVILQGQPGMTRRQAFSYLQQSGVRATASGISYFLRLFGRKSILDVQAQTLSSSEVSLFSCSASTAPSHCFRGRKPSFAWFCFGFCFHACCQGRLRCLAVPHALLHLWHSISCLLACHRLVIVSDASLSLTSHLLLLFWTAFMSHICYLIPVSHRLPPEK